MQYDVWGAFDLPHFLLLDIVNFLKRDRFKGHAT